MHFVFIFVAALFIILGIVFASGKGAGLIAGYNTSSPEEKAHIDKKKLLKAMSAFMFIFSGCFVISALSAAFDIKLFIWIGQALFAIAVIIAVIYLNSGKRFKK